MEFLCDWNAFPIKISSHSFHFDLFFFKQKIATGKESRLNNLWSARIFFFPFSFLRSLSTHSLGHLAYESWKAGPNCSFMGKTLGKCPTQCEPSHSCIPCNVQTFKASFPGWISWNFLLKKRVFLDEFQALFFTAVILTFSTEFFLSQ